MGSRKNTAKAINEKPWTDLQARFNALNNVQSIIEFDLNGIILTANPNFLKTMGYELNEVVGKHHRIFCDPKYAESTEYRLFWEKLKSGQFDSGEYKRVTKSGREIWIQSSYNPILDKSGKPYKIIKFATDITQQKFNSIETTAKISAISRVQSTIEFNLDGTVITANDNFLKLVGYEMDEIKGKHHRMFCEPTYASSSEYRAFWEKLNHGEFDSGEYKRVGKSGKTVWINASYNPIFDLTGKPYKVVKFATDVTATKTMISAIEESALSLGGASRQLTATATQMASTATKTTQESSAAASAAQQVSAGVQTVATNTEEMAASIKEIARSANESSKMAKSTLAKTHETNRTISKLGESSQEIGDVVKVINSIAQQTNLLALNATIEAARAGEAGKGFAVVANEVKELAKQTAKATQDIANKIGAIQKDSQGAVEAMGNISEAIEKLNAIAGAIAASVEEQTATTAEVSRIITESKKGVEAIASTARVVSQVSTESMNSSNQTLEASKGLFELAEKLTGLVKRVQV